MTRTRKAAYIIGAIVVIGTINNLTKGNDDTASASLTPSIVASASPTVAATPTPTIEPSLSPTPEPTATPVPATPAPDPVDVAWTRLGARAAAEQLGFGNWTSNTVAAGPRLMGDGPNGTGIEIIGDPVSKVDLLFAIGEHADEVAQLSVRFLDTWAPDAEDAVIAAVKAGTVPLDETVRGADHAVHIIAIDLGDGIVMTLAVSRVS